MADYGYGAGLSLIPNLRRRAIFGGGPSPTNNPFQPNPFDPVDVEEPQFDYSNPFPNIPDIGGGPPPQISAPSQKGATSTAELSSLERLKQIGDQFYTPEYGDRDKLRDLLSHYPVRENPGLFRTITASIAGLGARDKGIEVGDKIMNAPHARNLAEWTAKVDPYYKAAELENRGNINERQMAGQMGTALFNFETNERRAAETERKNVANEALTRRKLQIQQEKNNGATFDTDGEFVIGTRPDGSSWNTGTRTTDWDPFDLENLKHKNRVNEQYIDIMGNIMTKQTVPGANPTAGRPQTAAQTEARRNEMLLSIGKNPRDERNKFLRSPDGGMTFEPIPAFKAGDSHGGTLGFGGTPWTKQEEDAYYKLIGELYPGAMSGGPTITPGPSNVSFGGGSPQGQSTQQAPPRPPNEVNFSAIPGAKQRAFPEIMGRDEPNPPPPSGAGTTPTSTGSFPTSITSIMGRVGQMQPSAPREMPPPVTIDQVQQGVATGQYLEVIHTQTGRKGWIEPTQEAIDNALKTGHRVLINGKMVGGG